MKNKLLNGFLAIVIGFAMIFGSFVNVEAAPEDWDRSSLVFEGSCDADCEVVQATVCNRGDGNMEGESTYEVWYAPEGNPKDGWVVGGGTIPALPSGSCTTLTYSHGGVEGNYMFHAFQRPGHPGQGDLWSEACVVEGCVLPTPTNTLVVPTDTPTLVTLTPTPSDTPDPTATDTPEPTVTWTATLVPTGTSLPTATSTNTVEPTDQATHTPTAGITVIVTVTPTGEVTVTPTPGQTLPATVTWTATFAPTATGKDTATATPTVTVEVTLTPTPTGVDVTVTPEPAEPTETSTPHAPDTGFVTGGSARQMVWLRYVGILFVVVGLIVVWKRD